MCLFWVTFEIYHKGDAFSAPDAGGVLGKV